MSPSRLALVSAGLFALTLFTGCTDPIPTAVATCQALPGLAVDEAGRKLLDPLLVAADLAALDAMPPTAGLQKVGSERLAELRSKTTCTPGKVESAGGEGWAVPMTRVSPKVNPDGSFEILLAPEKPAGYDGNFMLTRASRTRKQKDGSSQTREYVSQLVMLRELFCDWENEDLLELFIYRNDLLGQPMPAYTPEVAAQQIADIGRFTRNQVHFWNEFYAVVCECYGDMNGDGQCFMPRNESNGPNAASLPTAGGMATNVYCGGIFELAPDEALVVEMHQPVEPVYIGFSLGNMWGESLDFANYQSSLGGLQAHRDTDNVYRFVISHTDPGIANWLDTTGQPEGYMAVRWAYPVKPKDNLPWATAKKVPLGEVRQHLPAETRLITPEERRQQIAIRQEHVQRRYRQH